MKRLMAAVLVICFFIDLTGAQAKILVISDIDDTLKVSHVLSKAGAASSALDYSSRFVGMSEIFQALQQTHADIEFHYISLAPKALMEGIHKKFLQHNKFPVTKLHLNPGWKQDPELKQRVIRQLLSEKQPEKILYFGDNGQFDVIVYAQMKKEFPHIPETTYIREAYSSRDCSPYPTQNGQIGFVTSVEVAMDLIQKNLIPHYIYGLIEHIVYEQIQRDDSSETFGPMVFPGWQDCRDFVWRWGEPAEAGKLAYIQFMIERKCQISLLAMN
ncbi:MAG: phosphatase domain-containing protein [Bdellovibrio sp.]